MHDESMATSARKLRLTLAETLYALTVAVLASIGFTTASTPIIVLSALLSLPSSILAVPAYYVAYGLVALVPGANSSSNTGSGSCTPNGDCVTSSTEALAAWFAFTSEITGVLALIAAALVNVAVLRRLNARRRARTQPPAQSGT